MALVRRPTNMENTHRNQDFRLSNLFIYNPLLSIHCLKLIMKWLKVMFYLHITPRRPHTAHSIQNVLSLSSLSFLISDGPLSMQAQAWCWKLKRESKTQNKFSELLWCCYWCHSIACHRTHTHTHATYIWMISVSSFRLSFSLDSVVFFSVVFLLLSWLGTRLIPYTHTETHNHLSFFEWRGRMGFSHKLSIYQF